MDWKAIDDLPEGMRTVFLTGKKPDLIDPSFYLDDGSPVYIRRGIRTGVTVEAYKKCGITHFADMPAPPVLT